MSSFAALQAQLKARKDAAKAAKEARKQPPAPTRASEAPEGMPVGFGSRRDARTAAHARLQAEESNELAHGGLKRDRGDDTTTTTTTTTTSGTEGEREGNADGSDVEDASDDVIPLTHEVTLGEHYRAVTALDIDPSGSRLVTGSGDFHVCIYDFNGMDKRMRPFRDLEPKEGAPVQQVKWSTTGDRFAVCPASSQLMLFDRDGRQLIEFKKGDQYLYDLRKTKGHIAQLTGCAWHPSKRQEVLTSSQDGTVRLWDIERAEFQGQTSVYKLAPGRGANLGATACTFASDESLFAAACQNGDILLYDPRRPGGARAEHTLRGAHCPGSETSALLFAPNNVMMGSRGGDDTLKLWDIRRLKEPVHVMTDLPNADPRTDLTFSPAGDMVATGVCVRGRNDSGRLCFYSVNTGTKVRQVGLPSSGSVLRTLWHPKLNQVIAGCGDGKSHLFYHPQHSWHGALLCATRAPRKKDPFDIEYQRPIHNPHSLAAFRDEPNERAKRRKMAKDPVLSRRPEMPQMDVGVGGKVATTVKMSQHLLKAYVKHDTDIHVDPREAILQHADAAAADQKYMGAAYAKTQPVNILEQAASDDEEDGIIEGH